MEKALKKYLLEQCRNWMLPEEIKSLSRLSNNISDEESVEGTSLANKKMELVYGFKDEKTNALVALGKEKLEMTIVLRLLKEHENEIINNCPKCEKLVRTPFAKQCRYCGNDWH